MEQNHLTRARKFADRLLMILATQTVVTICVLVTMCYMDAFIRHSPVRPRLLDLVSLEAAILISLMYGLTLGRWRKPNESKTK